MRTFSTIVPLHCAALFFGRSLSRVALLSCGNYYTLHAPRSKLIRYSGVDLWKKIFFLSHEIYINVCLSYFLLNQIDIEFVHPKFICLSSVRAKNYCIYFIENIKNKVGKIWLAQRITRSPLILYILILNLICSYKQCLPNKNEHCYFSVIIIFIKYNIVIILSLRPNII